MSLTLRNLSWLDKIEIIERLIYSSGGVSVSTLAHVTGNSRDSVERVVRVLVAEGRVQWSGDLFELKETRGRKGRLVVPVAQSARAAPSRPGREEADPTRPPLGNPDGVVLDASAPEEGS